MAHIRLRFRSQGVRLRVMGLGFRDHGFGI